MTMPGFTPDVRKVVDVVFSFVNRATKVAEKFFVRVDVGEPFLLVSKRMLFYDR